MSDEEKVLNNKRVELGTCRACGQELIKVPGHIWHRYTQHRYSCGRPGEENFVLDPVATRRIRGSMLKEIQAKHIPDERLLDIVRGINNSCWVTPMRHSAFWKVVFRDDVKEEPNRPAMVWDITALLPEFPPKVVMAKLANLLERGFLEGCSCGCRGDYKLTAKGRYRITPVTGDVP